MQDNPNQARNHGSRIVSAIAGLHVEIGILIFCGVILLGVGRTRGPVFDAVGPDFLPKAVAILVMLLVLVQIAVQLFQELRHPSAALKVDPRMLAKTSAFIAATAAFVFLLARGLLPLYLASSVFMAFTTVLLSHRPGWRDAIYGVVAGLVLGAVLQYVFTQILYIDLPG